MTWDLVCSWYLVGWTLLTMLSTSCKAKQTKPGKETMQFWWHCYYVLEYDHYNKYKYENLYYSMNHILPEGDLSLVDVLAQLEGQKQYSFQGIRSSWRWWRIHGAYIVQQRFQCSRRNTKLQRSTSLRTETWWKIVTPRTSSNQMLIWKWESKL